METCINWVGDKAYFSSDEYNWRQRILKLAESHPDDIQILKHPDENDGCLYAIIPKKWVKVTPPRTRELTEEQLAELRERMKKAQAARQENLLKKQQGLTEVDDVEDDDDLEDLDSDEGVGENV